MKRISFALIWLVALLVSASSVLAQQPQELTGQTGSNAFFHIKVPPNWNGDLVIWNHGFTLSPPSAPGAELGPLVDLQLLEGYAVAGSSYSLAGWAVFQTNTDLMNLYDIFRRNFGTPRQVFVTGASLGGIVTVDAIERGNIGNVVGALSACGALAGSRNWDVALDTRLVYDAICKDVAGAAIPGGAEGLPKGSTFGPTDLALALNACMGTPVPDVPPTPPTLAQFSRLSKFLQITMIPPSFIARDMGYATFALSDLVHDPRKLAGTIGTGNAFVDYGDPVINAVIERVVPNPGAANRLASNYTPTGDTRGAKVVSIHTDKDGLVIVENESEYAKQVDPGKLTTAIVVEGEPTHCGFTPAETTASWESLRNWVAGAPQPTAASIQGLCQFITANNPQLGGCRFDPAFVIPNIDGRVRPRRSN